MTIESEFSCQSFKAHIYFCQRKEKSHIGEPVLFSTEQVILYFE